MITKRRPRKEYHMANQKYKIGVTVHGRTALRLRRRPIHPVKPALSLGRFYSNHPSVLGPICLRPEHLQIGVLPIVVALILVGGCDFLRTKPASEAPKSEEKASSAASPMSEKKPRSASHVPIPTGTANELKDGSLPIVRVELVDNGEGGFVPVPYFYGYPLYGTVDGKAGVYRFREDTWKGYTRNESPDNDGVIHLTENFPYVKCSFYGILETPEKYVPIYLECQLPPPNNLGGRKRVVIGNVPIGATPQEILEEPSIKKAFLGEWHAVTPGFENGEGTGYFNTEHGQIGFGFKGGKLNTFVFMFDTPVMEWRSPELWLTH
jgi:hypothetical protein